MRQLFSDTHISAGGVVLFGKGNDGRLVVLAGGRVVNIPPRSPSFEKISRSLQTVLRQVAEISPNVPVRGWTKGEALMAQILGLKVQGDEGASDSRDAGTPSAGTPSNETPAKGDSRDAGTPSGGTPDKEDEKSPNKDDYPVPDEVKRDPIAAVSELMSSVGSYLTIVSTIKSPKRTVTVRK